MHPSPVSETKSDPSLPVYRIDESNEELIVGSPQGRFACIRAWRTRCAQRCAERRARRQAEGCTRSRCAGRFIKWIFAILLIVGLGRFFVMRHFENTHKPNCLPVTSVSNDITLPLATNYTKIFLHNSLSTGDVHIIHSDKVANGTVSISYTLPKEALLEEEPVDELFACSIVKPRGVGFGLFARGHKALVPAVLTTTVTLPADLRTPAVIVMGPRRSKCLQKGLRKHFIDQAIARFDEEHKTSEDWEIVN